MRRSGKNARNTRRPRFGGRKPNPVLGAKRAAEFFAKIQQEYEDAADGHRLQIYKFAQRCYGVGLEFMNDLDAFHRFMRDEFWESVRQKPKDDQIMKAVLTFAMNARTSAQRTKVIKIAKILDHLAEDQMAVGQVAVYLRENGGIGGLYNQLTGDANKSERVPDDLEILSLPTEEGEGEGEPEDSDEDDISPEQDEEPEDIIEKPTARPTRAATGHARSNEDELAATEMTPAARDGPKITDFGGVASPPKAPSLRSRFDPDKHLLIDLSEIGMSPEAAMKLEKFFILAIVESPDEFNFRPIIAKCVKKAALISGLWKKRESDGEDA